MGGSGRSLDRYIVDRLIIAGGRPLAGTVEISGAKNAALPILCASLLTAQPLRVSRVPALRDVGTLLRLLRGMGVEVEGEHGEVVLSAPDALEPLASYDLVKTMRASILVLGPLLARFGHARVSLPGGVCHR